MRIHIAGSDASVRDDYKMANAVGRAIEKEFTERLPKVRVCELMYQVCPIPHSLTLEYKGKARTYNLPSENSLQTAPAFCEVIVAKLIHELMTVEDNSRVSRLIGRYRRIFHDH